jgi:hypothetical protein
MIHSHFLRLEYVIGRFLPKGSAKTLSGVALSYTSFTTFGPTFVPSFDFSFCVIFASLGSPFFSFDLPPSGLILSGLENPIFLLKIQRLKPKLSETWLGSPLSSRSLSAASARRYFEPLTKRSSSSSSSSMAIRS